MYPFIRLVTSTLLAKRAFRKKPLGFAEEGEIRFLCWPWDLDIFFEMNNGRILTLYDLGRFDIAMRSGFWELLKAKKWGLAVAGSSVRYRRRVRLFDIVTMRTKVVGMDGRWIYIAQSMWVNGEATSSALLRTCVTAKGRSILAQDVLDAMGEKEPPVVMPEWVQAWAEGDKLRPWPPR